EDADGDGEIESRSLFLHIGGREVDGDLAGGQPVAAVLKGGGDARGGLAHGRVRKPDPRGGRLAKSGVGFDDDPNCVNFEGRCAPYFRKHGVGRPRGSPAPRLPRMGSHGKMGLMPQVTVIIPTYNWSAVLPYSIGSALRQTFSDFELLVIGDGCTDDSE